MARTLTKSDLTLLDGLPPPTSYARLCAFQARLMAQQARLLRYLMSKSPEGDLREVLAKEGIETLVTRHPAEQLEQMREEFFEATGKHGETPVLAALWAMEGDLRSAQLLLEEADVEGFVKPKTLSAQRCSQSASLN